MFPRLPSLEDPSSAEGRVGRHRSRSQPARLFVRSAWRLGPCRLTTDECPSLGRCGRRENVSATPMSLRGHALKVTADVTRSRTPVRCSQPGLRAASAPRLAGPRRGGGRYPDVPTALQKLASRAQRSRRLPTPFPSPLTQGNTAWRAARPPRRPQFPTGVPPE